jgi:uncharacterized protein
MKLHADRQERLAVTGYGPGWVAVNGERYGHSLILGSSGHLTTWNCARFEDLDSSHFSRILHEATTPPELVIFGSGHRLRFPPPSLLADLTRHRIGLETMDTQAACRTFNILSAEGRRVIAALLLEPGVLHPGPGSG